MSCPAAGRRVTATRLEVRSAGNPGRIAARAGRGASQGRLFFGDFLLATQKKVTRRQAKKKKQTKSIFRAEAVKIKRQTKPRKKPANKGIHPLPEG